MKEHDIRPEHLLQQYLQLSAKDAENCFAASGREPVACVGCDSGGGRFEFRKNGFDYAWCEQCGTLYQSPRPPISAFESFYRDSESSRYWADVFFPAVAEARRERIFRPRVERLADLCASKGVGTERLLEVGAGYGIFLDEWRKRFPAVNAVAVEPSRSLAEECRRKGFEVVEAIVENVRGRNDSADLVVCFEVLEHVYDPVVFVRVLSRLARPGGYVFISTLTADGFDIQVLWERSNSIFPPHHINFLSLAGLRSVFERAGLEDVHITTPGQLDVDIVRNAVRRDPRAIAGQRFVRALLAEDARAAAFQSFLAENSLSSHAWVLARRPGGRMESHG